MEFHELQDVWGDKKAPEHISLQLNRKGIVEQLYKLQRKTIFASLFVSVSFAVVFIILGLMWSKMVGNSWYFDLGVTITFLDMMIALGFIWSLVVSWKGKKFELDSISFIQKAIKRLKRRKFVMLVVLPLYICTLALGINLTYVHSLQELPIEERLLIHGGMTAVLILGMVFSLYVQRKHIRKKIDPLLEDLTQIKNSLHSETDYSSAAM